MHFCNRYVGVRTSISELVQSTFMCSRDRSSLDALMCIRNYSVCAFIFTSLFIPEKQDELK